MRVGKILTWEWQHKIICFYFLGWSFALNPGHKFDYRRDWPPDGPGFIGVRSLPVLEFPDSPSRGVLGPPQSCSFPSSLLLISLKILLSEYVSPKCFIECNIKSWREQSMLEFGYLFIWINLFSVQRLSGELRCTECKGETTIFVYREWI